MPPLDESWQGGAEPIDTHPRCSFEAGAALCRRVRISCARRAKEHSGVAPGRSRLGESPAHNRPHQNFHAAIEGPATRP
jgi:hypothetical protein